MERRLTAIVAADVVGYSRLMGIDEAATHLSLKAHQRELIDGKIEEHQGRVVKLTGDGMLIEFPSVVNALACSVAIQRGMRNRNELVPSDRRIQFRIGVNLGDVIVEGDDIFGDGVNLAARLEGIAQPGGIAISSFVRDHVGGKLDLLYEDIGEQTLKNIARPIHVFRISFDGEPTLLPHKSAIIRGDLAVPDKPSIAILPFQNMSGDPEQEYFADGIVEEITTALSRMRWLFVIARNSSFTYKGKAIDVKQVGRELGVRYVLEGSVRKAGDKVRITGQLIDTSSGMHLWADRFDGGIEKIFDLQDQITSNVIGAITPKLESAEISRAMRKPTSSLDAYDYFLRGMASHHNWSEPGNQDALPLFLRATELDPGFASAFGMAARCYVQRKAIGILEPDQISQAERLASRAGELGKDDADALWTAGFTLAYVVGDLDRGDAFIDAALDLNPNLTLAWAASGWVKAWLGEPEIAIDRAARAMRLSPHDSQNFSMYGATALAHFIAGRYAEALHWAEGAVRERPNFVNGLGVVVASASFVGDAGRASAALKRLQQLNPQFRIFSLMSHNPLVRELDRRHLEDGLRKSGLHA